MSVIFLYNTKQYFIIMTIIQNVYISKSLVIAKIVTPVTFPLHMKATGILS